MAEIKVATLNLFNRDGAWERRAPLFIDQLEALVPDVIGLQEIDMRLDQAMWAAKQINGRISRPHYRVKHATHTGKLASYHGIATLARTEVIEHEVLDLMTFDRVAQRLILRSEGTLLTFINLHLHHPPDSARERQAQAEYVVTWLDRDTRGLPTVVLGDFNAYLGEETVAFMKRRFRSVFEVVHGREPEKTWPTPVNTYDTSPQGTLDYIFVSDQVEPLEAGLAFDSPLKDDADLYPSDHLGLFATLRF